MNLRKRNSYAIKTEKEIIDKENISFQDPKMLFIKQTPLLKKSKSLQCSQSSQKLIAFNDVINLCKQCPEMEYSYEIIINQLRSTSMSNVQMDIEINNTQITSEVRSTLISWIIDVHKNFKFLPETLYLCISIIDSFAKKSNISKYQYQLIGLTALFIASKYEQINTPLLKDFIKITDNLFDTSQILKMQGKILCSLNFKIIKPSIYMFMNYFNKYISIKQNMIINKKYQSLCKYVSELILISQDTCQFQAMYFGLCIVGTIITKNNNKSIEKNINLLAKMYQLKIDVLKKYQKIVKDVISNYQSQLYKSVNIKYKNDMQYFNQMLKIN